MKKFLLGLFSLVVWASVSARNYYVAASGNDAGDGSRVHPWRTLRAVNGFGFAAGDSVFLRGGEGFRGTLRLMGVQGVYVGSYGKGHARMDAGDSSGVVLSRCGSVCVRGLLLVGKGRKTGNVRDGLVMMDCVHCVVVDVDISGFQKAGLLIYGCTDIEVRGIVAHENGAAGIAVEGPNRKGTRDIRILGCRAENNAGDPTNLTNHSGNGIVCGHCTGLLIERCSATNNGWDMPRKGNGPVGIWCYETDSAIIRYCASYKNRTSPGAQDGGGFDLDGGVTNSVIEHCLSYGNAGAGYGLFQYSGASLWHDNIIRDNVSEDDGSVSDAKAGIYVWNATGDATAFRDCIISGNTVYNSQGAALSFSAQSVRMGFAFTDNTFVAKDSLIRGVLGYDGFKRNKWWVLQGDDHQRADAAERGAALYGDPGYQRADRKGLDFKR